MFSYCVFSGLGNMQRNSEEYAAWEKCRMAYKVEQPGTQRKPRGTKHEPKDSKKEPQGSPNMILASSGPIP